MSQTLCSDEDRSGGVLSATCRDLLDFVTPMPASYYSETKCNWASEDARPRFVAFDAVPAQCVGRGNGAVKSEGSFRSEGEVGHYLMGAATGIALCVCVGCGLLAYLHTWLGFRLAFVRLQEEQGGGLPGLGQSCGVDVTQLQMSSTLSQQNP